MSNIEIRIFLNIDKGIEDCNDESIGDKRSNSSWVGIFSSASKLCYCSRLCIFILIQIGFTTQDSQRFFGF